MTNELAARWLPPIVRGIVNRVLGTQITYRGPFQDWREANALTTGYQQDAVVARVDAATRSVLRGESRYEQDGVTFKGAPPPAHALEGLLLAAAVDGGRLSVVDLGGGLASHYLRWQPLLSVLPDLHWAVIEQPSFVSVGMDRFADDPRVSFHESIDEVSSKPNAVLASAVLQYLPEPYIALQRLLALNPHMVVLDRTPHANVDAVVAQFVPRKLGEASYPLWALSQAKLHATLTPGYELLNEFDCNDQPVRATGIVAPYRGSIWLRRA